MSEFKVVSVNISQQKGTIKTPVDQIEINKYGVNGDAHAGDWNRQVSLLAKESMDRFEREAGRTLNFGEFAENITTEGIALHELAPLDTISIGDVKLEVTRIGKKCHGSSCAIYKEVGNCVMPKEGIFARVKQKGFIVQGSTGKVEPRQFKVHVITLSDRASRGEYEDRSGPAIIKRAESFFKSLNRKVFFEHTIIPDDPEALRLLIDHAEDTNADILFTTGGTGIGPRDFTPDVVRDMLDMEIPGVMEAIRLKFGAEKPHALLSRSIAGVAGQTLVYSLPGSVKAVDEYLGEIFKSLMHSIFMLHGLDMH
ncbi:MAG: MOSC domain-containing protein [Bacteroidales bacterium]|nr:MOSC domain-containing protein [Bacteroidales bacterium]